MEIEKIQQKYNSAQEKTIESQTKIGELVDKLERAEQNRLLSNQQLADTSATMHAFNSTRVSLMNLRVLEVFHDITDMS